LFIDGNDQAKNSSASATAQNSFDVGGITHDGPDTNQFHIEPHNGAHADGFWYTNVASELDVSVDDNGKLLPPIWKVETNTVTLSAGKFPDKLPEEYQGKPYLNVSRELVAGHKQGNNVVDSDANGPLGKDVFVIPVLEHTKPVAAELDGKRVDLTQVTGNTYAVTTIRKNKNDYNGPDVAGKLNYWLVPDDKAPMPKAEGHLRINPSAGDSRALGPRLTKLQQRLEQASPTEKVSSDNGAAAKRISQEWRYALDPFTAKQKESWKTLDDMLADAEKNKEANCNIANTDANLSDPATNEEIGFLNSVGSKSNDLSSFELHQRTIRRDATPSVSAPVRAEAKDDNSSSEVPYKTLAGIGAGVLLAASQRRRVVRVSKKVLDAPYSRAQRKDSEQDAQVEYAFAAHSDDDYITAVAAAEHLAWSDRPLTQAILQQSKERLAKNMTGARSRTILGRSHLANSGIVDYLVASASDLESQDAALAQQVRQSARVLADGADVLAIRNGAASTEHVDRLQKRLERIKRAGRKIAGMRTIVSR
jgi:type II secretory pathway component PulM